MTKRFWTPERKKDFYNLQAAREHRREYMRNYMQQARAAGKVKLINPLLPSFLILPSLDQEVFNSTISDGIVASKLPPKVKSVLPTTESNNGENL